MENRADYLHRRAKEEDAAANRAASHKARELHEELATRYRDAASSNVVSFEPETVGSTVPRDFRILD